MSSNTNTTAALLGRVWGGDLTPAQGQVLLARRVRAEEGRAKEAARAQARAARLAARQALQAEDLARISSALVAGERRARAFTRAAGEALQAEVADGNLPREEARRLFRRARDLARLRTLPGSLRAFLQAQGAREQAEVVVAEKSAITRVLEAETPEEILDESKALDYVQSAFALIEDRCLPGRTAYASDDLDRQILAERQAQHDRDSSVAFQAIEESHRRAGGKIVHAPPVRTEQTMQANALLVALGVLRRAGLGFPGVQVRLVPYKHAYGVTFWLRGWKAEVLFGVLGDAWPKANLHLNETNVFVSLPGPQVDEALDKLAHGKARAQLAQDNRLRRWRAEEDAKEAQAALACILQREDLLPEEEVDPARFERKAEADRRWDDYDRRVLNPLFVATQEVHRLETMTSWDAYDNPM